MAGGEFGVRSDSRAGTAGEHQLGCRLLPITFPPRSNSHVLLHGAQRGFSDSMNIDAAFVEDYALRNLRDKEGDPVLKCSDLTDGVELAQDRMRQRDVLELGDITQIPNDVLNEISFSVILSRSRYMLGSMGVRVRVSALPKNSKASPSTPESIRSTASLI